MTKSTKKLHLGCFDKPIPGWINVDITHHIHVTRIPGLAYLLYKLGKMPEHRYRQHQAGIFRLVHYLDVRKPFPYRDNTFDFTFSSHMFEHLFVHEATSCVGEIRRVLKKGGILRVSVPDLDRIVTEYDPQSPDLFLEKIFETRQKSEKNRHHWHYNEVSMTNLLRRAGFTEVYRTQYRQGNCADVTIIDNRPESLFMEAVK